MSPFVRTYCSVFQILNYNCCYVSSRHAKNKLQCFKTYLVPSTYKSSVSTKKVVEPKPDDFANKQPVSFEKTVENRQKEACRTILVQVHSEQSCTDLHEYCSQYGEVKGMHHYSLPGSMHCVLVEFQHDSVVDHIIKKSQHSKKNEVVPVRSPFLWFRAPKKLVQSKHNLPQPDNLKEINGNLIPSPAEVKRSMQDSESLSDQILVLHRMTCLSDLGSRLKFLTARQVELALSGLFPEVKALPFGSSVNGFGKAGCDLDLVLIMDKEEQNTSDNNDLRLIFHAKTSLANGRSQVQRYMETLGDVCQHLLPGCSQVRRILQARVPIIKYHQDFTGVECDLSMTNMTAVYMSELLYILGESDWRVRPLVFAIRSWAREFGLTNATPGRWITNFSLTLLVLFYLQQKNQIPVLPALNTLISLAGPKDQRVTSDGVNCTFTRDISQIQQHMRSTNKKSSTTESLETLFIGFFEFYSAFDFVSHAVSLVTGRVIPKPEHSPLYIVNPLERSFNVSKNVSHDETERLRIEFRNAAWLLESLSLEPNKRNKSDELWGLNALLESPQIGAKGRNIFYVPTKRVAAPRIVDISELFHEQSESVDINTNKEDKVKSSPKPAKAIKTERFRRR